ncbi:MAG: stage II sporulation protein M [Gemmatimonadota bacterium]
MAPPAAPRTYRQHIEVETPEHVVLDLEIAGVGSRALASLVDLAIILGAVLAVAITLRILAGTGLRPGWSAAVFVALVFLLFWGYFTLFEALREGQTPGKRRVGIRVLRDTGHPVTFAASAARNLLRIADFLPPPYLSGALLVALHPRGKRLGDMVAGTIVVRDRPADVAPPRQSEAGQRSRLVEQQLTAPLLTEDEYRLLAQYGERSGSLDPAVRRRFAAALASRFAAHLPPQAMTDEAFILALLADETARRQGRLAGRGGGGTGGLGDRLAARKSDRWDAFQKLAQQATARGLDSLPADQLTDFAARYREVAADLARLRTYRASPAIINRVERLVAAGHNVFYRDERTSARAIWYTVAREFPAAVVQARWYVLAAFVAFAVPLAVGFVLLRDRPALAEVIIPQVMLDRADEGKARMAAGHTYAEAGADVRPFVATFIITNNIRVAITCFAGGVFAGVGSLVLLAYNGLALGTAAGHFANVGVLGYLLQFIVGHGPLELFSIWVAGAAGLMLGRTVLAPGDLARGDALVLAGRRAVRMVGAAAVCLLVAGTIEGFVSTAPVGLGVRVAASAVSVVFLAVYLTAGWRAEAAAVRQREPTG